MALKIGRKEAQQAPSADLRVERLDGALIDCRTPEEFAQEIATLWREAEQRYLMIGRYLIRAKAQLPHGAYLDLIEHALPFGPRVAQRLVIVAAAIDGGALPKEQLPPSYSTIYVLATLPPEDRDEAVRVGLVRPDVRRAEIEEFKRQRRATRKLLLSLPPAAEPIAPDPIQEERARILSRLAEIQAEEKRLRAEKEQLEARLDEIEGGGRRIIGPFRAVIETLRQLKVTELD